MTLAALILGFLRDVLAMLGIALLVGIGMGAYAAHYNRRRFPVRGKGPYNLPELAERYGLPNVSPLTPLDKRRLSDFRDRMPVRPV